MQSIPFHIAYLLTRHECVIVPDLGAFIISPSDKEKTNRWGILSPPEFFLGFNPEIKHNDGLLTKSVAKGKNYSFHKANLLIAQYVTFVTQSLDEGKKVHIPWVGNLYLKDNEKLFQQERNLSCNALNFGLTGFSLHYLKDIQLHEYASSRKKKKKIVWFPFNLRFTGLALAALIAMCIIPTPLNNHFSAPEHKQYASLIHFSVKNGAPEERNAPETDIQMSADVFYPQKEPENSHREETNLKPEKLITSQYYIIIASLPDQSLAEKTLARFQSKGLENVAILQTEGKLRIYSNRFNNKDEAEKSLIQFRKDYPEHANAWVLKQKV